MGHLNDYISTFCIVVELLIQNMFFFLLPSPSTEVPKLWPGVLQVPRGTQETQQEILDSQG